MVFLQIAESTTEPQQVEDSNTPSRLGVLAGFAELLARKRAFHGLRHEEPKDKVDRSWPSAPCLEATFVTQRDGEIPVAGLFLKCCNLHFPRQETVSSHVLQGLEIKETWWQTMEKDQESEFTVIIPALLVRSGNAETCHVLS